MRRQKGCNGETHAGRAVYLLRHGRPEFPDGTKVCLGNRLDIGLSAEGKQQAIRLQPWFMDMELIVTSSRLKRARETAAQIRPDHRLIGIDDHFNEIDMGQWEGKSFDTIRKDYPDLYASRGRHESMYPAPGGEDYKTAQKRVTEGMMRFSSAGSRVPLIVGHAGIIRLFLSSYMGVPLDDMRSIPQEYGCINVLLSSDEGWKVLAAGLVPQEVPCPSMWPKYYRYWNTPAQVVEHCTAVRNVALEITDYLLRSGVVLDRGLVASAAMLHDTARLHKNHDRVGAEYFAQMGYKRLADILLYHHDFPPLLPEFPCEEEIVYLADKMVCKTEIVNVDERFRRSRHQCITQEAKMNHSRRYMQSKAIEEHVRAWLPSGSLEYIYAASGKQQGAERKQSVN